MLVQGPILTSWIDCGVVIIEGTTSNPTKCSAPTIDKCMGRRIGDTAHLRMNYKAPNATGATAGSGDYIFKIPVSFCPSIDTSKISVNAVVEGWNSSYSNSYTCGTATFGNTATATQGEGNVVVYDSTHVRILGVAAGGVYGSPGSGGFNLNLTTIWYSLDFFVPIVGW